MKKYLLSVFIFLILATNMVSFGQDPHIEANVTTPTGISIAAERFDGNNYADFDSATIVSQNNSWTNGYNCRIIANSTMYYNCHGYAWHNIEGRMGQSDLRWIDDVDIYGNPVYNVTKYYTGTSPSYSETQSVTNHLRVSYFPRDHSAVTTEDEDSVISKWAYGPLVKHTLAQCPFYDGANIKYYKLNPFITGSSTELCATQERTFSSNTAIPGSTYSWTKDNSLLDYVSGSGTTDYRVEAKNDVDGSAWLQLQITTPSGEVATTQYHYVWVGKPLPSIVGSEIVECYSPEWYFVDNDSRQWDDYQWSTDYNMDIVSSTIGYKANIQGLNEGYGQIFVEVTNTCGSNENRLVVWVNCSKFLLSPNPASNIVQVTVTNSKSGNISTVSRIPVSYKLNIYDLNGILYFSDLKHGPSFTFPVSNLKNGSYIVSINDGKKTQSLQLIVKH